jgi:hypothetical protein
MSEHFIAITPTIPAMTPNLSLPALHAMQKKGGNTLGLDPLRGPYFYALIYMSWRDEASDDGIMRAAKTYLDDVRKMAEEMGLGNEYIYIPYASP